MCQTFQITPGQLYSYLQDTVRTYAEYHFERGPADHECKIYYSEKAIILECSILPQSNGSKLHLHAMSPICIITDDYALIFTKTFFTQLDTIIRNSLGVKGSFQAAEIAVPVETSESL